MKFLFLLVVPISYFTPLSLRPASFGEIKAINESVTIAEPDAHARSLVKHLGGGVGSYPLWVQMFTSLLHPSWESA